MREIRVPVMLLFAFVSCAGTVAPTANVGSAGGAGAGGSSGYGEGGDVNCPAQARFEITIPAGSDPSALCLSCGALSVTFTSPEGTSLQPASNCSNRDCETCQPGLCLNLSCSDTPFPSLGSTYDWNGGYFVGGTCGAMLSCEKQMCAAAGHYSARFCAINCGESTSAVCANAEFDLPSSSTIAVELRP